VVTARFEVIEDALGVASNDADPLHVGMDLLENLFDVSALRVSDEGLRLGESALRAWGRVRDPEDSDVLTGLQLAREVSHLRAVLDDGRVARILESGEKSLF